MEILKLKKTKYEKKKIHWMSLRQTVHCRKKRLMNLSRGSKKLSKLSHGKKKYNNINNNNFIIIKQQ